MFPHKITIFHHDIINDTDVYTRCVVSGVYWYGSTGISASGKGLETSNAVSIVTSAETAHSRHKTWNVCKGDRIVKGEYPDITSLKDLNAVEKDDIITVTDIAENLVDSDDVDNIVITGK